MIVCLRKMIVVEDEPVEVVPNSGDVELEHLHESHFAEELKQKGIVPPRPVVEGTSVNQES